MQAHDKLKKIYQEIDQLDQEKKDFLQAMFQNAPDFVYDNLEVRVYPKDTIFIREYATSNGIYILVDGTVRAMEYRILGMQYDYMRFRALQIFGGMEVLLDMKVYGTSLVTMTDCTFFVLEKEVYKRWLDMDTCVLRIQAKNLVKLLFEQGRKERILSFLQGRERLFLIFMEEYDIHHDQNGKCRIEWTQNRMSASSGLSVRTINRAVRQMSDDGYITYHRGRIRIDREQYEKMKAYLDQIIAN